MKKKIYGFRRGLIALCAMMGIAQLSSAQVGVGISTPDPSAQLQIESTNKGLLIPRVTSTALVTAPANGLIVYQTGGTAGFYYNSGNAITPVWLRIADASSVGLADGAVTDAKVAAAAAIAYSKLNLNNSIQNGDITANAVTTSKVANGTVTTSKMADSAISGLKILSNAVNNAHIADGVLNPAKINVTGATSGQVLSYNGSTVVWSAASGGATGAAGGDLTGTFPNPTVANSSITSAKILDGTIQNGDIAANAITTSKVANGTVTTSKMADSAISGLQILSNAVNNAHIANGTILPAKLSATGATAGQVLGYNGSSIGWTTPSGGGSASGWSFSATTSISGISASTELSAWTVADPYYATSGFNPATGAFTVPTTGNYLINATVNYKTTAAVTISQGAGVEPYFEVIRTSPVSTSLIQGYLPVLDVNIALLLTLRSILGSAAVPLNGIVKLNAGDVVKLKYNANGLTIPLNIGGSLSPGVVWSVTKLQENVPD